MERLIVRYKDFILKAHASEYNTTIFGSHQVKSRTDMKSVINYIRDNVSNVCSIHKRSISSMIHEWRVHNLLYSLGILRDRVKDVDLNIGQPWYIKTLYFILSPLYLHFK